MDCEKVRQEIFLYIDKEMDEEAQAWVSAHLSRCGDCSRHIRYTIKMLMLVRQRCSRRSAPDGLRSRILERLRTPRPVPRTALT